MNSPIHQPSELCLRQSQILAPVAKIIVTLALLLSMIERSSDAATFSDDFNDGNDKGWEHQDPLSILGPSGTGTWLFPGGNTYQVKHPATPSSDFGTARASSFPMNVMSSSNFIISVDVVNFANFSSPTPALQAFGLLVHGFDIGIGSSKGIAFLYENLGPLAPVLSQPYSDHITITRVANEQLVYITGNLSTNDGAKYNGESSAMVATLSPTAAHRFVFMGRENRYEGRVYRLPDLAKPVAICAATNSNANYQYSEGIVGITAFNYFGAGGLFTGPVDVTFDNFFFDNNIPDGPAPSLHMSITSGTNTVSWPGDIPGIWELETSPELGAGALWVTIPLWQIQYDATLGRRVHIVAPERSGYFRLRKL